MEFAIDKNDQCNKHGLSVKVIFMEHKKKWVLITGASGSIGLEIVKQLLDSNYLVIAQIRNNTQEILEIKNNSKNSLFIIKKDFEDSDSVKDFILNVTAISSQVDVIINCAGGGGEHASWSETTWAKWNDVFRLNVFLTAELSRVFSQNMILAKWGRIINIASVAGIKPLSIGPEYAAAKAAVISLTVSLAKACESTGVTVNAVSPGLVITNKLKDILKKDAQLHSNDITAEDQYHNAASEIFPSVTGKLTEPKDIAALVLFLISDASKNVTGQNLVIDGGYTVI